MKEEYGHSLEKISLQKSKNTTNTKIKNNKNSIKAKRSKKTKLLLSSLLSLSSFIGSHSLFAAAEICWADGFKVINTCEPNYWMGVNGRLEFDEIIFSGKTQDKRNNFPSSGNLRRAFISFNGGAGDCFTYNLSLDFGRSRADWNVTDVSPGSVGSSAVVLPFRTRPGFFLAAESGITILEEAWIGYNGLWDCTSLRFGQITPLATMDGYTNYGITTSQMFLESALATRAFDVPSYLQTNSRSMKGLGIILNTQFCDLFTLGTTLYQPAQGPENVSGDARRSDRIGGAIRLTFSPIHDCDYALHMGFLARYQSLNHTDNTLTSGRSNGAIINTLFFTTPEVTPRNYVGNPYNGSAYVNQSPNVTAFGSANDPNIVNTGAIRAKSYNHLAYELAGIWGPLTTQAEYHYANVQRVPYSTAIVQRGNVAFHGAHVQVGYVLTGESRGYDFATGTLGTIKPCTDCGAWELAARYSYLNLMDKDVYGGAANNFTLGVNWYANDNIRCAFNYLRSSITPTGFVAGQQPREQSEFYAKRKLNIFALRIQAIF